MSRAFQLWYNQARPTSWRGSTPAECFAAAHRGCLDLSLEKFTRMLLSYGYKPKADGAGYRLHVPNSTRAGAAE